MRNSKLSAAALSAIMAASALSLSAGATCIPEGREPVLDLSPAIEGSVKREEVKTSAYSSTVYKYYYDKNGNKIKNRNIIYLDMSDPDELGSRMLMVNMDKETGELGGTYTGFTRSKKGLRYYQYGERIYGWFKYGKSWYHFNENGYADTGRVELAGGKYTFDENGRWTGKLIKSALAPEDFYAEFGVEFGVEFGGYPERFNSDGFIKYGDDMVNDCEVTAQVKLSDIDRQIMYAMFMESGFEMNESYSFSTDEMNKRINKYTVNSDFSVYDSEPSLSYTVKVSFGGESTDISFCTDCEQVIHIEEDFLNAYNLTGRMLNYQQNYLYKKYPRPEGISWFGID